MKKYFFLFLLMLMSCKKEVIPDPEAVLLIAPENNDNCNTAVVVSDQQSQVNFVWQKAAHTDEYELVVRDILTNFDQKKRSIRLFSSIVLDRGKQYSWWINSKSEQTENITQSKVWTFYLEGLPISSHFPFPAKLLSPENNAQISLENGTFTLRWEAVDLDNDIKSYDVYLGVDPDDLNMAAVDLTTTSFSVNLTPDRYYYWKVTTKDLQGNISHSTVGVFMTFP
jgi:hypothetical protein